MTRVQEQRVLVTGGCGFIGSNIADALASRGDQVFILDNLSRRGTEQNAEWLRKRHGNRIAIEVADVRNEKVLRSMVKESTSVLHLAAQVAVTTSLDNPREDFEVNGGGTLGVLEAVRQHNPWVPVILASTNKVYGKLLDDWAIKLCRDRYVPCELRLVEGVAESAPLDFYSPYGCSKGTADQYVRDYARVFGMRTVVLRMSCIYGPRQFGNEDQGWIAHFLIKAIRGEPITIYGDGYQVRDGLYIDDAVNAWLAALDRIDVTRGRVFNLGGGPPNATSLREMMALIEDLRGQAPDVRYGPWRPGDQPWYVSNIRAIGEALGWAPRMSLRDGVRKLERWLAERELRPTTPSGQREEARV
ncbi:MAG TPA: GDP-mannose 4,6-dehydratase [Alphaproteobacteria bacterium]|jgi:CDP-paratose 2-epimerase|nr:GDP-mannose 4,6-dehydratase [Alphaproteobacteria bacterium]